MDSEILDKSFFCENSSYLKIWSQSAEYFLSYSILCIAVGWKQPKNRPAPAEYSCGIYTAPKV